MLAAAAMNDCRRRLVGSELSGRKGVAKTGTVRLPPAESPPGEAEDTQDASDSDESGPASLHLTAHSGNLQDLTGRPAGGASRSPVWTLISDDAEGEADGS
mmetsp:Transcript_30504/g.86208  ORF Transcript_30504/g.86208 Transcript_30504/m.86208 type:complete len:101 (+) Transcript_30504:1407-1709(+)